MTHSLCLTGFGHDLRLTRQLNAFELRHFFLTLDFAAGLRDRTYIPAKKREELRLTLGFGSSDLAREKLEKRLRRYHDLELLRLYDDGSILLTYLLDQDDDDDLAYEPLRPAAPAASHTNGSSDGSGNGSSSSGNGSSSSGNGHAPERRRSEERRQPGRVLSQNPDAVRKRAEYWAAKEAEEGPPPEVFAENLQDFASKPPAMSGEFAPEGTQNLRMGNGENLPKNLPQEAEVSRVGVGSNSDSNPDSGEFINSLSPDSKFEFEENENLRAKTSAQKPPAPTHSPARPEPPELAAEIVKLKRAEAVKAVLALTNDPPVNRHLWLKYWDICHLSGNLPAWDEAQARLRKALMDRSEEIGVRAAWLTTALRRLLEEADHQVFIPTKAQIADSSQEDIRALLREKFPSEDAEPEPAPALAVPAPDVYQRSRGRITPLEDRFDGDAGSQFEEEEG